MATNAKLPEPEVLPATGKSRFNQFKKFLPISKETFRQLSKRGRAPQPERLGIRCTFYDNAELHKWLADPLNYRAPQFNDQSQNAA
ncbi:transcriptional regulator [Nitrosomonas sp.]|uniref:helix-turn-helix transcriptional regulator n=1 Tax=Nitrosomonas sp. TaxID=42353 RepID=UPI00261DC90C|nr:transcriptional regulator [Nitrosomonas sp.]MCW5600153.1 transcriptional regulator [Nitrosomonas sp.]